MTLSSSTRRTTYTGNGATTSFAYTFPILETTHVEVILTEIATGEETELLTSQYSISGVGGASGGNVTYPLVGSPLASTHQITIQRTVPYTQDLDISSVSAFNPTVIENQLDLLVMMIQQLAENMVTIYTEATIIALSQEAYDALTPDEDVLYVITT